MIVLGAQPYKTFPEKDRTAPIRKVTGMISTSDEATKTAAGEAATSPAADDKPSDLASAVARGLDFSGMIFGASGKTAAAPEPAPKPDWKPAPLPDGADEATKAAYAVATQQMLAGHGVAHELAQTAALARAQDVPTLMNRLLETYSDLGSVFVQLLTAAIARDFGAQAKAAAKPDASAAEAAPPAAASPAALAVVIQAASPVEASADLHAPLTAAAVASGLTRLGGTETIAAPTLMDDGAKIRIIVGADAVPGDYYGVILASEGGAIVGNASVKVLAPT